MFFFNVQEGEETQAALQDTEELSSLSKVVILKLET